MSPDGHSWVRHEAEIAKLRRELAEIGGAFSQSEKYREDAHSQLAVIVDEAFGPQEVLPLPNLLSRLERLLTERARQHEEVRRELDRLRRENDRLRGALESITSEFERAVREADRPRGGQQVPPGGDFVAAIRLPSFVGRARWWARELRAVLEGKP